jgi:hypothetical protein
MRTEKSDKKLKPTENEYPCLSALLHLDWGDIERMIACSYAEILDSMCDPEKPQGEWVRMIDLGAPSIRHLSMAARCLEYMAANS